MDFLLVFQNVAVLFLLIIVGYITGRVGIISKKGQQELSQLTLKVTMPATIILAMQLEYTRERFLMSIRIIAFVFLSYLLIIALSKILSRFFKLTDGQKDILEVASILPNTSFMGYPIVLSILGGEALFFAVLGAGLVFEIISWTYGMYNISKSTEFDFRKNLLKNIFLSPGIISIIIGFILFIFSIKIPEPFNTAMSILSQATSPLAMLVVGILLSRSNMKECLMNFKLYIIALIKLVLFPGIVLFFLKTIGLRGMELIIPVVMLSMPTAAYVAMFSESTGNDANFASQIVFISSLLSLVTIPIMVLLVTSI